VAKRNISNEKSFLAKFGEGFLSSVPTCPGVYFVYNESGQLIYIGKAKNLRRRLGQYKNAKRRKKHAKMRSIVAEGQRIEFRTLATDLEACLEETRLIQQHRPKWNVAGAFYFLYPMIGVRNENGLTYFCYTTQPELFPEFRFHGAYRSRHMTKDAFFALMDLLSFVGHRVRKPSRQAGEARHSYVVSFRQLPDSLASEWAQFWKGESKIACENLVLSLVENAGARHSPKKIQENLNYLKRFWRHEAAPLQRAIERTNWPIYPVPQKERDILFLKSKNERARKKAQETVQVF
jgi:predicted GIY-YIG superfamily endonuclease